MEMKHTPGPWWVKAEFYIAAGDDPEDWQHVGNVTDIDDDGQDLPVEVWQANAKLIAAAPDLLAACKEFVNWYGSDSSEFNRDNAYERARAAIAKAEGEEA